MGFCLKEMVPLISNKSSLSAKILAKSAPNFAGLSLSLDFQDAWPFAEPLIWRSGLWEEDRWFYLHLHVLLAASVDVCVVCRCSHVP
jgi:hypothetical protein